MKCKKKQVKVEARQLKKDYDNIIDIFEWVYNEDISTSVIGKNATVNIIVKENGLNIPTLEGDVKAKFGDYIVKGINREFYPVSENKFKEIYNHLHDDIYIKKPIETEAIQYHNIEDLNDFCYIYKLNENKKLMVRTDNGIWLEVSDGDYIIKEENGFHPVKPDIFKKTYKEIES